MLLPMAAVIVAGAWARAPGATTITTAAAIVARNRFMRSLRERIGAELELHDLARRPLAAFDVEGRSCGVGRPQPLTLPAGVRIVNTPVHPFGVEAHGVGNAKDDELPVHQGEQRLVGVPGADRHVPSQPEGVELIDPGVVACLGAARIRHVHELWPRVWMKRPAFRTVLTGRGGPVERPLAFAADPEPENSARQGRPEHGVASDVPAPPPLRW